MKSDLKPEQNLAVPQCRNRNNDTKIVIEIELCWRFRTQQILGKKFTIFFYKASLIHNV